MNKLYDSTAGKININTLYPMNSKCSCEVCERNRFITKCRDTLKLLGYKELGQQLDDVYNGIVDLEEESDMQIADLQDQVADLKKTVKVKQDIVDKQAQRIKTLTEDVVLADEEFFALEKGYDELERQLKESKNERLQNKAEVINQKAVNATLKGENDRYKVALDNADRKNIRITEQIDELKAKQPHPGDVKMGAIIKKAFQDLQAAELEKNLCKPTDYKLKISDWY